MKKILMTITLAFAMAAGVLAQDTTMTGYRSFFGSESTEWICGVDLYDLGPIDMKYSISGDTVIDGTKYKIVRMELNRGLAREDTSLGRLWVKWHPQDEDELVVDLSLSVGDSFDIGYRGWYVVDSVYVDSEGRKTIHLTHDIYEDYYMKEGVGAEMLWSQFFMEGEIDAFLICAYHDDTLLYTTTLEHNGDIIYDSCKVKRRIGIEEPSLNIVNVYPNPFLEYLIIEAFGFKHITICDMKGFSLVETDDKRVDLRDLPSGLYIVAINFENKVLYKKVIKR